MRRTRTQIRALRLLYQIRREFEQRFLPPRTVYVWNRVPYYRQLWAEACEICDHEFVELSSDTWEIRDDGKALARINNCYVELDNPVTLTTAGNKRITYDLLEEGGLPVTRYRAFTLADLPSMHAFMEEHPGPFVVKPSYGTGSGIGVTTHLTSRREATHAAVRASLHCPELLIEQQVAGEAYRLLCLGGEVIAASRRRGLWVTGDGRTTVQGLYMTSRPADVDARTWLSDADFLHTAPLQGVSHTEVLGDGVRLLVKSLASRTTSTSEVRTVYDEDALDALAPEVLESAETAAGLLRSEFCGVDIITPDPSMPLEQAGGAIGEVNTTPGLHHHYRLNNAGGGPHIGATVLRYVLAKETWTR